MVTHFQRSHALAHRFDDTATFMTQDAREYALGILAGQGVRVGVADAGGDDTHQDFTLLRRRHIDFDDFQRLVGGEGNGSTGLDHLETPERRKRQRPPGADGFGATAEKPGRAGAPSGNIRGSRRKVRPKALEV